MLSVAIPTLNRGQVLLETLRHLFTQEPRPAEILVLDQTLRHEDIVQKILFDWHNEGTIRWVRLPVPWLTKAMNQGLRLANSEMILFLDDDIVPAQGLIAAHLAALNRNGVGLVAGRVIQPWEMRETLGTSEFRFSQAHSAWVSEFMGGNFSVRRGLALAIGGFDENFVRVGYRFEAEFAYRWLRTKNRIYFEPAACIHHLKVESGGTRTFGHYLRSCWPSHSVGAYYYCLRTWCGWQSLAALLSRFPRLLANRHHLQRPWWIPATVVAELSGMVWALFLALRGPRYITTDQMTARK